MNRVKTCIEPIECCWVAKSKGKYKIWIWKKNKKEWSCIQNNDDFIENGTIHINGSGTRYYVSMILYFDDDHLSKCIEWKSEKGSLNRFGSCVAMCLSWHWIEDDAWIR